ncbi:hypothetical protein [Campylobacter sp.]|uniref:hypothetical protein n=1 Tax=Campylobacter sp. TaxID=205 RepID=UPI00290ADA8E|nr:hypothetical protein [Campylobacter sp.]MDU6827743.1 hypothetical protein [Campylobacter sp.]
MIYKIPDKKIFAGSAKSGELVEFPDIERGWGVTENTGFVPPMEYFNGAFNRVDNALMYLLQNGVSVWDKDLEYPIGALVQLEGKIYLCKQQHTNQNPQQHTDYWKDLTDFYTKAENNENFAAKNHNHDERYLKKDEIPYATESKAGIVRVKNSITGVQEDVAVSEKAVAGIASIGINQTWQDMTSQRQPNITYTNTTGRSIFVLVRDASASANGRSYDFYVDDINICPGSGVSATSIIHLFAIIPPGSTYKAVVGAPFKWYELR